MPTSFEQCAERLALTDWNRLGMLDKISVITARAPFTNRFDFNHRATRFRRERAALLQRLAAEGPSRAIGRYRLALRLNEDDLPLHSQAAKLFLKTGRYQEAIAHCQIILRKLPRHPDTKATLAAAFAGNGQWFDARMTFEEFLQESRHSAPADLAAACIKAAALAEQLGQPIDTLVYYDRALTFTPSDNQTRIKLAWLMTTVWDDGLREPQRALALLEEARETAPEDSAEMLDALAAAYAALSRFPEAIETASRALELANDSGRPSLAIDIGRRLLLYRRDEPFVQSPPAPSP